MVFDESKYARGTGAQGGQFVVKGDGGSKTKAARIGFDGKRGAGYGAKGGDDNVKALQKALNRLGITDSAGKPLAVDGKFGPKTTAAVRRLQRKLGIPVDGKVTPGLLKKIQGLKRKTSLVGPAAKKAAPKRVAAKAAPAKAAPPARKPTPPKTLPARSTAGTARRSVGYSTAMTDFLARHGSHNQKSHGNRLGKPNVPGKTGHARTAEDARVGTNDVRLDDEVEIVPQPGTTQRGGNIGKKGRIVDLEAVRPIVELWDGGQIEVLKSQLKVTRTRRDKSLDKDLRDKMDREIEKSRRRTARARSGT